MDAVFLLTIVGLYLVSHALVWILDRPDKPS
jgi:hypothetical protein